MSSESIVGIDHVCDLSSEMEVSEEAGGHFGTEMFQQQPRDHISLLTEDLDEMAKYIDRLVWILGRNYKKRRSSNLTPMRIFPVQQFP